MNTDRSELQGLPKGFPMKRRLALYLEKHKAAGVPPKDVCRLTGVQYSNLMKMADEDSSNACNADALLWIQHALHDVSLWQYEGELLGCAGVDLRDIRALARNAHVEDLWVEHAAACEEGGQLAARLGKAMADGSVDAMELAQLKGDVWAVVHQLFRLLEVAEVLAAKDARRRGAR